MNLLDLYRTDNVPLLLRPLLAAYGFSAGVSLRAVFDLIRATTTLEIIGAEHLARSPNHIFCHWHEYSFVYPIAIPGLAGQVWLQHPSWYMKPMHVFLERSGVQEVILGSSGHAGRAGADAVVRALQGGASTVILPDGPHGPPHGLKKGVLHIAAQSGVPIVPLRFELSSFARLPGWDGKQVPLPGCRIRLCYASPIWVRADDFPAAAASCVKFL